jgi:hypothetical protein
MTDRPVLELLLGDVVRLRRTHPCGGSEWLVDRLGADIGLRCRTCNRHVLISRRHLEERLALFVERGDPAVSAAVSGSASGAVSATAGTSGQPPRPDDRAPAE